MPHPRTRAKRVIRKLSPSSSPKKRHRQEIPCIRHVFPASTSKGKITSTMTTVIARGRWMALERMIPYPGKLCRKV